MRKLVDGHHGEDGVAADERVAVFEVGENGRNERLNDLRLVESTQESEGYTSDVLVRVLEIVAEVLADEDHLRENLTARIGFVDYLEVEKEKLLDRVVLRRKNVPDYCDEELRNCFTVQEEHDGFLQSIDLQNDVVSFQGFLDLVR